MRKKENAVADFIEVIVNSWTYDRMTGAEREKVINAIREAGSNGMLRGDYITRYNACHAMYSAFLAALDYRPINWREAENIPTF